MKNISKKLLVLLCTVMMLASLTACGSNNNNTTSNTQTPEATQTAAANEQVSYPITVTDSDGVEFTIEKEPTKIVSAGPNVTEMIYKLGASDKLVGRTDYCDYPSEVTEITSIGSISTPDIETIISLEPDYVFASTHFSDEYVEKLKEANIPVIMFYEETDVTGVYTLIDTLGKILNKQEEATATVEEMKTEIASVTDAVKDAEKVSVYYVVGYGEYGDFTATGETFVGAMLEMAGGDNIAADATGWSYSLETLLEKDPEVIIVGTGEKEGFMTAENYKELTAVKEGKVYEIDRNLLDRQGYRNAEGIKALAEILHPDLVK